MSSNFYLPLGQAHCKSPVNLVACGLFYFYGILHCNFKIVEILCVTCMYIGQNYLTVDLPIWDSLIVGLGLSHCQMTKGRHFPTDFCI